MIKIDTLFIKFYPWIKIGTKLIKFNLLMNLFSLFYLKKSIKNSLKL
jgi:hypothetical protein